jgi:hypothetical protein
VAEYQDRIFEPFFRLPGASDRVGAGQLVKSISDRHQGMMRQGFALREVFRQKWNSMIHALKIIESL